MTVVATNKTMVLFNRTSDICRYLKQKKGSDFVLKIVYDIVSQHGKFAQKCPIEKNVKYYFDNFTLNEKMIPNYVPLVECRNLFTMTYSTKEGRKFIPIVISKIYGGNRVVK